MKTFDIILQNHQILFSIEDDFETEDFVKSFTNLVELNQISLLSERYEIRVEECPSTMNPREYFSCTFLNLYSSKLDLSVQKISFLRNSANRNKSKESITNKTLRSQLRYMESIIKQKDDEIERKNLEIARKDKEISRKDEEISRKDEEIARKDEKIISLFSEFEITEENDPKPTTPDQIQTPMELHRKNKSFEK
jgi:hypothetical protein